MPNSSAAKKALRQNIKQNLVNRSTISRIKTAKKKFLAFIEVKNIAEANTQFSLTQSLLAKAAKKHIIHWKKAARLTSRMSNKFPKSI